MRFYSAEWVAAFNEAVASLDVAPELSLRMLQLVGEVPAGASSAPDGAATSTSLALEVGGGHLRLELDPLDGRPPDVTVALSYEDAAALSRGEVDPAELLASGRVKVRGDLSALVKGQALLAEAAGRVAALSSDTTYSVG